MISLLFLALPVLLAFVASFGIGIVMIIGGLKMMRLQSHGWAMTASILALLPCSPVGILGLVVGIWSLVVLSRRNVREAFDARATGRFPPQALRTGAVVRTRGRGLLLLAALLLLPLVVLLYWFRSATVTWNNQTRAASSAPLPAPDPEPSTGWLLGANGPTLTSSAVLWLKLKPAQTEEVNKILETSYQEYLALEVQNTQRQTDDAGHVVITIKAFPAGIAKLEDHLWSQLDTVLDTEQQSWARLNLKLDAPPELQPGLTMSELVGPGLFGWGKEGARIEIWRVGSWSHWKVQTRGREHSDRAPQLPQVYRRFWTAPATAPEASKKTAD